MKEDLYSIIDSCFMPCGVECDQYYIIGEIKEVEKIRNIYTKEEIYRMKIESHDLEFMEEKVAEFNATNTMNIEVTYEAMTDNYDNNLELAFQSNQAPDIFRPKSEIVPYVKKGMAIPIDEFLTDEDRERYGDTLGIQNVNVYDGQTYSIPTYGNNYRLIYNKDVFRKAGLDPEKPPQDHGRTARVCAHYHRKPEGRRHLRLRHEHEERLQRHVSFCGRSGPSVGYVLL